MIKLGELKQPEEGLVEQGKFFFFFSVQWVGYTIATDGVHEI